MNKEKLSDSNLRRLSVMIWSDVPPCRDNVPDISRGYTVFGRMDFTHAEREVIASVVRSIAIRLLETD